MAKQKWFHAIGVCGKTTANIAKMFQDMGWFVTGSDMQFLPPASDILTENDINTVEGYHYSHLTKEFWQKKLKTNLDIPDHPDLGLIMSFLTPSNKEYRYAKLHNIDIRPYAKVLGEFLIKDNSIVVAGTAGKTTTTALITYILKNLGLEPSYMIGAEAVDLKDSIANTKSNWSVVEGDEYHSPEIEGHAKFIEYKPMYLLLTNIGWEHQDIFPTQEDYVNEFKKLVALVPENGIVVAKAGDKNIDEALANAKCKVIRYSTKKYADSWYAKQYGEVYEVFNEKAKRILKFKTKLLGEYNIENILGAIALITNLPASELPIDLISRGTQILAEIAHFIENFHGVKKRLEVLYADNDLVVIDDFGVTPSRAANSLKTLKQNYEDYRIVAVFEPNSGSRPKDLELFNEMYKKSFENADKVVIPTLSEFKDEFIGTREFVNRLGVFGYDVVEVQNSELKAQVENIIKNYDGEKVLVVFFSSYRLTQVAESFIKD